MNIFVVEYIVYLCKYICVHDFLKSNQGFGDEQVLLVAGCWLLVAGGGEMLVFFLNESQQH